MKTRYSGAGFGPVSLYQSLLIEIMAVQRCVRTIYFLVLVCLAAKNAAAQDVYIPPGASVHFFAKDTAAIFGNLEVNGYMGQDSAQFLYFSGNSWKNTAPASFGEKGIVAFRRLLATGQQTLSGAYSAGTRTGVRMPVLWVNNSNGLLLENNSDVSLQELHFVQGVLSLNGASLVVRNGQALAPVSGYHQSAFVNTGDQVMGGFLEIENLAGNNKTYVWPVGTTATNYTPLSFRNSGGAVSTMKARVFKNVFEQGLSGTVINNRSTGTTWMLNSPGSLTGRLSLQHNMADEGPAYAAGRANAFAGRFLDGTGAWETSGAITPPVSPGTLTTGAAIATAATTYADLSALPAGTALYTGLVSETSTSCNQQLMSLEAQRLSPLAVRLNWVLQDLNNLNRMVIEKDVYNNDNWRVLDSLLPGTGTAYSYTDTAAYSNTSSGYRIRMVCNLGGYVQSNRVLVSAPAFARDPVLMYPNPATLVINVAIPDYDRYISLMIYDLSGHMLIRQTVTGPVNTMNVSALPAGSYNIFLVTKDNKVTGNLRMIKVN